MDREEYMLIINFDGWNVGTKKEFNETWLEFDSKEDAMDIARHWQNWIEGLDV